MPKKRVITTVQLQVDLTVPAKRTPGHVLQWVTQVLQHAIDQPPEFVKVTPSGLRVTLTKKETTYA